MTEETEDDDQYQPIASGPQKENVPGRGVAAASPPSTDTLLGKIIFVIAIVWSLGAVYHIWQIPIPDDMYLTFHLSVGMILFLLLDYHQLPSIDELGIIDKVRTAVLTVSAVAALLSFLYIVLNYDAIEFDRFRGYPEHEVIMGAIIIITVLIMMYRAYGLVLTGVTGFAILYAAYGPMFPGLLEHAGVSWDQIILFNTIEFESGVYGFIVRIGATWIFVFLIWAGLVEEYGGLQTFLDIGFLVGKRFESGIAQTAVVSSMIMGSISGSPMANSVVTGSFTIPLMKERGIAPKTAGAIEATASTGGMILPPIMGAVAFLMANFLNMSYGNIIVIAALPAILFYVAIALSVHLITIQLDVDSVIQRDVNQTQVLKDLLPIVVSVVALVYFLVVRRYSSGIGGVYTIAVLIPTELLRRLLFESDRKRATVDFVFDTFKGFRTGSIRMIPLMAVIAGIGILISSVGLTGLGYRLSSVIVDIAGGTTILLLVLVAVSSIVMGMGMPTVAAYVLTITLIAPAMVDVGFQTITAHFFVFYYAMLASITPPIALACAVTCKIAEENFMTVAIESVKVGLPLFLIPFIFAFNESLLSLNGMDTAVAFVCALAGLILIVFGIHGNVKPIRGEYSRPIRITLLPLGLLFAFLPMLSGLLF